MTTLAGTTAPTEPRGPKDPLEHIEPAMGHYRFGNYPIFRAAYQEIVRDGLDGKNLLEVCAGYGDLAGWLAGNYPGVRVVAIDQFEGTVQIALGKYGHLPNLQIQVGDAMDLSRFADGSFDQVIGQATMHHLSNNLGRASKEFSRVLKRGGKCLFIFEPLGHNPFIATFRTLLNTRTQFHDESFIFEHGIRDFAANFSRYEVQYFNLFSFWAKSLPAGRLSRRMVDGLYGLDGWLFRRFPRLRKQAGCFNVMYWK